MKIFYIFLCILILLDFGYCGDKLCMDAVKKLTKVQLKVVGDCKKAMKFKDAADKKRRATCVMKCALETVGVLDKHGKITEEQIGILMEKYIPEPLWPKVEAAMEACKHTTENLDGNDETCKTYQPMISCGVKAFSKICK